MIFKIGQTHYQASSLQHGTFLMPTVNTGLNTSGFSRMELLHITFNRWRPGLRYYHDNDVNPRDFLKRPERWRACYLSPLVSWQITTRFLFMGICMLKIKSTEKPKIIKESKMAILSMINSFKRLIETDSNKIFVS